MFNPIAWILGACIIVVAATIQSITGFGFALFSVPFLMMVFEPKIAIALNIIVSFCTLLHLFLKIKDDTNWVIIKRFFIGSLFGLPLGFIIFNFVETVVLKILVSSVILILTLILSLNINLHINTKSKGWQLGTGSISGFLTGSTGMGGPPVVLFLSNSDFSKEKFRATCTTFFGLTYLSTLVMIFATKALPAGVLVTAFSFIPCAFIGSYLGNKIFSHVSPERFKKVVFILLLMGSSYSLISSIGIF